MTREIINDYYFCLWETLERYFSIVFPKNCLREQSAIDADIPQCSPPAVNGILPD